MLRVWVEHCGTLDPEFQPCWHKVHQHVCILKKDKFSLSQSIKCCPKVWVCLGHCKAADVFYWKHNYMYSTLINIVEKGCRYVGCIKRSRRLDKILILLHMWGFILVPCLTCKPSTVLHIFYLFKSCTCIGL